MAATPSKPLVDVRRLPVLGREFDGRARRLPRLGRHVPAAASGDRGDGRVPARVVRADPPRRLRAGARGHGRVRVRSDRIAEFVGWDPACSIFTRNATEAINLVAYSWGRGRPVRRRGAHHRDGAPLEHRPWQMLCEGDRRAAALSDADRGRRAVARGARLDARRGPREAGRRSPVSNVLGDQPRRRDRPPRPGRRRGDGRRRRPGGAAGAGRPGRGSTRTSTPGRA